MKLETYFDFIADNDIRIKGTRIGIETVLIDNLTLGLFPEQIAARYPTLSLEQIYATLTFYWHNQEQIDLYLAQVAGEVVRQREAQQQHPSPAVVRLREMAKRKLATA